VVDGALEAPGGKKFVEGTAMPKRLEEHLGGEMVLLRLVAGDWSRWNKPLEESSIEDGVCGDALGETLSGEMAL